MAPGVASPAPVYVEWRKAPGTDCEVLTANSLLTAAGIDLLEVEHLLGHQNATLVTQAYGRIAPDDHRRAAAVMDSLLERHGSGT